MRKRFDPELYKQNDELAKQNLFKLLEPRDDIHAGVNPKKRGVDVIVSNPDTNETLFYIECEIKRVWNTDKFPYDSVQFPERKAKYAKLDKPTLFVMFNHDQSKYLVVKSTDLLASPLLEVPNKYMFKGELFFQVPLDKVKFNDINSAIKELQDE